MSFFKGIQKLNIFWRRIVIFCCLFVLAIPLGLLVAKNLQQNINEFDSEKFSEDLRFQELGQGIDESLAGYRESKKQLEEELGKIEEQLKNATSATSTILFATSTVDATSALNQ